MSDAVKIERIGSSGTVRFTLTCGECGDPCGALMVQDVPAFTLKVAETLFGQAMAVTPGVPRARLAMRCPECDRLAGLARDDRRDNARHASRPL